MKIYWNAILLALSLIGCTSNARQPALHDFGWTDINVAVGPDKQKEAVTVDAPSWLWESRIRYRLLYSAPTEVRFYGQDMWIASPPELFQQQLRASDKIQSHRLLVKLQTFEQQFDTSDKARVLLHFSAEVYSADNLNKKARHEFKLEQITNTPDAKGAISGFANLSKQAVSQLEGWLSSLPDSH
ncbi:MAG: hypothetical protein ABL919_13740 [Methylococcales bacterium]|nr:hypothetical protein [Methylococcaceae bacterium]